MNVVIRTIAYGILALPMMLVTAASQNIWGSGPLMFVFFIFLYVADFLIAVTAHEMGHAVAARMLGWRVDFVAVFPFIYRVKSKKFGLWLRPSGDLGGTVAISATPNKNPANIVTFAAAGPIANFVLTAITLLFVESSPSTNAQNAIGSFAIMSLLLGMGNLLPWRTQSGLMSDGATIISILTRKRTVSRRNKVA